jgi:hypothetical protein
VPGVDGEAGALSAVARAAAQALEKRRRHRRVDVEEDLRRAVRRRVLDLSGTRPAIDVHVLRL